jgi:glycosyltransferase involved in cell wall biosynthesis
MRILVISNFYPPVRPGGYAQWCHEVAECLRERGHTIGVLTSNYQLDQVASREENVYRILHLEGDLEYYQPGEFFLHYRKHQRENLASLKRTIREFKPDVLFIWGMWSMSKTLPAQAEHLMPSRVVYYLSDYWPANKDRHTIYWNTPPRRWYLRGLHRILGYFAISAIAKDANPELNLEHTITVSKAVKDILIGKGFPLQGARVIHGGTDIKRFDKFVERDFDARPLRLLYAGQLEPHKGVHTAISAVAHLVHVHGNNQMRLSVAGSGHPKYVDSLIALVKKEKLENYVEMVGPISKDRMPALMQQHAVLVFPSIYEEPFARMTQEAMLAGMVVVGTPTGGTKEILVDGKNGLIFSPEDSIGLSNRLSTLLNNPQLCRQLAAEARQTVLAKYTLDGMVDLIEEYLNAVFDNYLQKKQLTMAKSFRERAANSA